MGAQTAARFVAVAGAARGARTAPAPAAPAAAVAVRAAGPGTRLLDTLPVAGSALLPLALALLLGALGTSAAETIAIGLGFSAIAGGLGATLQRRGQRAQRALGLARRQLEVIEAERDAALQADQDKSRFLAIASHDLRQPVHALGLFGATLENRLRGTPDEPSVRNLMRAIDGLERSLTAMLDISRLDAGTVEPSLQHFPLRDLFRRLHMQFAGQAELDGLALRFWPGGKTVTSDPQLLERILANLIQNALKNTEQGGVVVVARSTASHINVEVWDTGIGIVAAELPRIFGEFYQVGRSERDRSRGLGMGLAIVARLARLLGHTLEVSSRPGRGTMFRIGIPLGGLADWADATAAADTVPGEIVEARTILIVDDESAIREGLAMLLEEWGYEAVAAADCSEVEQAVAAVGGRIDLILCDLHLGDGPDGLAAIDTARRSCGSGVPAILVTGDTSAEEMRRITESGHRVLFKPLQARKLFNLLHSVVGT